MGGVILVAMLHRWDRCEEASQGGHLPTSSLPGQGLGSTHTRGGSVPGWVQHQGFWWGLTPSFPAPRRSPGPGLQECLQQRAQLSVQPLQKLLCPWEWVWAKHWLCGGYSCCGCSPQCCHGKPGLVCRATAQRCAAAWEEPLPQHHIELHPPTLSHTSAGKIPLLMI